MSLFSKCNDCWICSCFGGHCYAGNGDDDYFPASKEQIFDRLSRYKNTISEYEKQQMIDFLRDEYGIEYNATNQNLLK